MVNLSKKKTSIRKLLNACMVGTSWKICLFGLSTHWWCSVVVGSSSKQIKGLGKKREAKHESVRNLYFSC